MFPKRHFQRPIINPDNPFLYISSFKSDPKEKCCENYPLQWRKRLAIQFPRALFQALQINEYQGLPFNIANNTSYIGYASYTPLLQHCFLEQIPEHTVKGKEEVPWGI